MNSHHQPAEWAKTSNILENGYFGVYGFTLALFERLPANNTDGLLVSARRLNTEIYFGAKNKLPVSHPRG